MKILSISIGVLFGLLECFILISDIVNKNENMLHNQSVICIIALFPLAAIGIINRYKIVFDYDQEILTYTSYLRSTKQYTFDEISISRTTKSWLLVDYHFQVDGKRIFKISEVDFEGQTKASADYLKHFFKGNARVLFDVEKHILQAGLEMVVFHYDLDDVIGVVSKGRARHYLSIRYLAEEDVLTVSVHELHPNDVDMLENNVIERLYCHLDTLADCILELSGKYLS